MNIQESQMMGQFVPSVFEKVSKAINKKTKETSKAIIDLSIGSPDLPPDQKIRKTLQTESAKEDVYYYTLGGTVAFNEAVAQYYKRRSKVTLNPQKEVLQTMGSQEGIVHFPLAFCNPGDIVLTTDPAYVAYDVGIKLAKAKPYYMPLLSENDFLPDLTKIPESILKKAKILILNLPGNPVPATPTEEFFNEVVQFAKRYNILVLHDAAYSEYYFSGDRPISFLQVDGAKEVGVEINSLSKSFSLAGARIAYFVGNERVIEVLKRLKSNLDYGIFYPIQQAAITALNHAEDITDRLRKVFSKRHQIMKNGLQELNWKVAPSTGGMFLWAKYPFDIDDESFVLKTIDKIGVVFVPGSSFGTGGEGYVRIALVQESKILKEALNRLELLSSMF